MPKIDSMPIEITPEIDAAISAAVQREQECLSPITEVLSKKRAQLAQAIDDGDAARCTLDGLRPFESRWFGRGRIAQKRLTNAETRMRASEASCDRLSDEVRNVKAVCMSSVLRLVKALPDIKPFLAVSDGLKALELKVSAFNDARRGHREGSHAHAALWTHHMGSETPKAEELLNGINNLTKSGVAASQSLVENLRRIKTNNACAVHSPDKLLCVDLANMETDGFSDMYAYKIGALALELIEMASANLGKP